jgi:hypothetical protein
LEPKVRFLFADHTLDVARRELRRDSDPIPVEPQVFDLLVYLVQNRDRVVGRIGWIANYENLAQYEAAGLKLLGDQKYQEIVKKASGILVPNTLNDEIWRTL